MTRIYLICVLLIIFSCSKDEEHKIQGIVPGDTLTFRKVHDMIEQAEIIWPGYDYLSTTGSYIILTDENGSNPRGYFLNPSVEIAEQSNKLSVSESSGLDLYRNDKYLKQAFSDTVLSKTGLYSLFSLVIKEKSYFVIKSIPNAYLDFYHSYKNVNKNWLPLVITHEMFHKYQFGQWETPGDAIQDFFDYPLTEDVILYELAMIDLMAEAHHITGETAARELLPKFIALYEKMIAVDPTEQMLVKRMGSFQMYAEGSARYVEHFSAKNSIYPTINEDPTHGWRKFIYEMNESTDVLDIRRAFAFRIWYHSGAGLIHTLKEAGVSVEPRLAAGITPYQLALEEVDLSAEQKEAILEEMMSASGWNTYVEKASYLHGLLE